MTTTWGFGVKGGSWSVQKGENGFPDKLGLVTRSALGRVLLVHNSGYFLVSHSICFSTHGTSVTFGFLWGHCDLVWNWLSSCMKLLVIAFTSFLAVTLEALAWFDPRLGRCNCTGQSHAWMHYSPFPVLDDYFPGVGIYTRSCTVASQSDFVLRRETTLTW
jgi:hypothetical protein